MNFASKYIFAYEQPEYEYVSEEEYEHGMSVSCSDSEDEEEMAGSTAGSKSKTDSAFSFTAGPAPPLAVTAPVPPAPGGLYAAPAPRAARRKMRTKKASSWKTAHCLGAKPQAQQQQSSSKRFRRADTNVVSISLKELVAASNMHAGDPIYCTKCKAVLSKLAKVEADDADKVWKCDFCEERNLVDVEEEEIPKSEDVTFLVEPAPSTAATGPSGLDESLVIFCVDISGSMCVTTEVPGKLKLKGSGRLRKMQSFNETHEDQYLPRQRRDMTYVSRLQAVQAAIDHQLEQMQREHPSRRVGLVTFDNEVTIVGDGTEEETVVVGDKLKSREALTELGQSLSMPKGIKVTRNKLSEKLYSLEEGGATALGPALVVSVAMASNHPGSKVIICTDGMANVGMGKLEDPTREGMEEENFYETIGSTAMDKGVAISVVTIKGTDCKLVELGKLADKTGGQVNIVDPLKLTEEFSNILADSIIATNVVATFILHKQLYINNIENNTQESTAVREVGNVTCDTEITFEYCVRTDTKKQDEDEQKDGAIPEEEEPSTSSQGQGQGQGAASGPSSSTSVTPIQKQTALPDELPFQIQVCYTDTDGMKALRVLTQTRPVTFDRDLAEKDAELRVLGVNAAQMSANLALQGEYTMSRGAALMNQRLAWRHARAAESSKPEKKAWYRKIFNKIQTVDHHVTRAQNAEKSRFGSTYSDNEDEEECYEEPTRVMKKRVKKMKARSSEVQDSMASEMYSNMRLGQSKLN